MYYTHNYTHNNEKYLLNCVIIFIVLEVINNFKKGCSNTKSLIEKSVCFKRNYCGILNSNLSK